MNVARGERWYAGGGALASALTVRVTRIRGLDPVQAGEDVRRRLFGLVFLAITTPVVLAFAVQDLLAGNLGQGMVELAFTLTLVGIGVLIVVLRHADGAFYAVLTALGVLLAFLILDDSVGYARLYWFYLAAPVATFTLGRFRGMIITFVYLVLVLALVGTSAPPHVALDQPALLRFVVSYMMLGALMYVSEMARERIQRTLLFEHRQLLAAYDEIRRLSITDSLTGAYNRQFLTDRLPAEVERARRYVRALSIVMFDVDHFKSLNDTYGHPTGDAYLRMLAATVRRAVRAEVDWLARYGGEEFLLVLPETDAAAASRVAERLRTTVSAMTLVAGEQNVGRTASFGVSTLEPDIRDAEDLIRVADERLYSAKHAGRNRVEDGTG